MRTIYRTSISRKKMKKALAKAGAGKIRIESKDGGLLATFIAPTWCKGASGGRRISVADLHNANVNGFWGKLNRLLK